MIICVLVKAVPDTATAPLVSDDSRFVITDGLKFVMNPYDEYALEEAVIIGARHDAEVVAVGFGGNESRSVLRTSLALGVDRAVHIQSPDMDMGAPNLTARVLAALMRDISPGLILAGCQAVDTVDSQVPERIAETLHIPHVSNVTKVDVAKRKVTVHQECPEGSRVLNLPLPALLTVQKGINVPRYPTVPDVMKAKRKPFKEIDWVELESVHQEKKEPVEVLELIASARDRKGQVFNQDPLESIGELLNLLRTNNLLP